MTRSDAEMMADTMKEIVMEVRAQGITQNIKTFNGESSTKFHEWVQEMDAISCTSDDERMRLLVTRTMSGPAVRFACRTIADKPTITWKELRTKLREQYSELKDPYCAQEKLRQIRQHRGELIQNYAERLQAVACEAFDNVNSDESQRVLVEIFQKGVTDDRLARALIRKKFNKFQDAVDYACKEQQTERTFELCRGPSSGSRDTSEIDSVHRVASLTEKVNQLEQSVQTIVSNLEKLSKTFTSPVTSQSGDVNAIHPPFHARETQPNPPSPRFVPPRGPRPSQPGKGANFQNRTFKSSGNQRPNSDRNQTPNYQWTNDGRPVCAFCSKIGHMQRNCWAKTGAHPSRSSQGN